MYTKYWFSRGAGYVLSYFRTWFPDIQEAWFAFPDVSSRDADLPAFSAHFQSRGKHDPGDGPIFVQHVNGGPSGSFRGFIDANRLFILQCEDTRVVSESGSEVVWFRKDVDYLVQDSSSQLYWGAWNFSGRHQWVVGYNSDGSPQYKYSLWTDPGSAPYDPDTARAIAEPWFTGNDTSGQNFVLYNGLSPNISIERTYMADLIDTGSLVNLGSWINEAYVNAFDSMPAIRTNNVQNLFAIFSVLRSILVHKGVGSLDDVGSLRDAWLGYRYSYGTTKMDIEEIASYCERMSHLKGDMHITGHGYAIHKISSSESYIVKCSLEAKVDDYLGIYSTVESLGLALDGYNSWDLIPYSFIIDWFLHIGDLLESARSRNYAMRLKPSAVWASVRHEFVNSEGNQQVDYHRFIPDIDLSVFPVSFLSPGGNTKTSTWVKRGADALCLFT